MRRNLLNYKTIRLIQRVNRVLRSKWLCPQFKSCGHKSRFEKIGLIEGFERISIGDNCMFSADFYLTVWTDRNPNAEITIGHNCAFGAFNHITSTNSIKIGNNVLTGKWVTITDNAHGDSSAESMSLPPLERPVISKGPVVIGNNVWIGDKATILPAVTIGDYAIIGANSVVTGNVPAYAVVAGNPAKIIHMSWDPDTKSLF